MLIPNYVDLMMNDEEEPKCFHEKINSEFILKYRKIMIYGNRFQFQGKFSNSF